MLCGDLNGKEIQKRGDIRVTDSLCCTVESNQRCKVTPIKILKNRISILVALFGSGVLCHSYFLGIYLYF